MFSTIKKLRNVKWTLKKGGCSSKAGKQEQNWNFRYDCENLAGIAKISQS